MLTDAPPAESQPTPSGRQKPRFQTLKMVLITTFALWLLLAVALWIYTADSRKPTTHTLEIPDGTIELIATGENPLEIPSTWAFLADDTLVLDNHDRVDHWLGNFWVPAHDTREYNLQPDYGGSVLCSLHPTGAINIDVGLRDFDWKATVVPTLALGPFVGLILAGTRRVMNALDEPVDERRSTVLSP